MSSISHKDIDFRDAVYSIIQDTATTIDLSNYFDKKIDAVDNIWFIPKKEYRLKGWKDYIFVYDFEDHNGGLKYIFDNKKYEGVYNSNFDAAKRMEVV